MGNALLEDRIEAVLETVQKPSRYIGGEANQVRKPQATSLVALCYPDAYEIDTAHVYRGEDGWSSGMSSNGDVAFIPTSDSVGTLIFWREAPVGTTAGRFVTADQEATFAVENGFVVAVFDEVPSELWPDYPRLTEWLA